MMSQSSNARAWAELNMFGELRVYSLTEEENPNWMVIGDHYQLGSGTLCLCRSMVDAQDVCDMINSNVGHSVIAPYSRSSSPDTSSKESKLYHTLTILTILTAFVLIGVAMT